MKRYGVPYMGSKNKLALKIIGLMPPAPVLYDLFAGGCAVTHAALEDGRFGKIVANDIDGMGVELFRRSVAGEYAEEKRWIDRETFNREKDRDPYISLCWSFGNIGYDYLYSREIEPWKKAIHYARVLGDFSLLREMGINGSGSRPDVAAHHDEYKRAYIRWYLRNEAMPEAELSHLLEEAAAKVAETSNELREYLRGALRESGLTQADVDRRLGTNATAGHYFSRTCWHFPTREQYDKMCEFMPLKPYDEVHDVLQFWVALQSLQSLQRLQNLQSLQSLQRFVGIGIDKLVTSRRDYAEVDIDPAGVIYCDIPYEGTALYRTGEFDHQRFFEWARAQSARIMLSSYQAPDDWEVLAEFSHRSLLSSTSKHAVVERVFVPRRQRYMWQRTYQPELFAV